MNLDNFRFEIDADGVALVTWDMPGRSMNVLTPRGDRGTRARSSTRSPPTPAIKGAVVTSGKDGFLRRRRPHHAARHGRRIRAPRQGRGRRGGDALLLRPLAPAVARSTASSRPAANRSPPRSTASAWAAASNWRSPATIASSPTATRRASACPKSRSACSPAAAARSASRG